MIARDAENSDSGKRECAVLGEGSVGAVRQTDESDSLLPAQGRDAAPVDSAGACDADAPEGGDVYLDYITNEYRRFRMIAWVLAIVGVSIILIGVSLNVSGIADLKVFNLIMSVGNFFIVVWALVLFMQVRPLKKRVKAYTGTPLHTITDPDAQDGVRIDEARASSNYDTNDMYKILERKVRTEVVPDGDEYGKLRRVWLGFMAAAAAAVVLACALYLLAPNLEFLSVILLLASFALVVAAFYVDRTKMKPLRNEYVGRFGMTEMKYRDNMH